MMTDATQLIQELQAGKTSPIKLTDDSLNEIEKKQDLNAFIFVNSENAKAFAKKMDQLSKKERKQKKLFGLPIVIADVIDMRGTPTTFGSLLLKDRIPEEDAPEILSLKEAGAVILGKTNLSEFGLSYVTENRIVGTCHHPINPEYTPGGSNAGAAAAIASGLAPIGLATDHRGSVRMTASFCGLYSLLPTRGLIPTIRKYSLPYTEKMFYRKGVIGKSISDLQLLTESLISSTSLIKQKRLSQAKIGWTSDFGFLPIQSSVKEKFLDVIESVKSFDHQLEPLAFSLNQEYLTHFKQLFAVDRFVMITNLIQNTKDYDKLMPETIRWLEIADQVTASQYAIAQLYLEWLEDAFDHLFKTYDFILTPVSPVAPFPRESVPEFAIDSDLEIFAFTLPFNMTGHPAMTIPAGFDDQGMPIGVQIIAKKGQEGALLTFAALLSESPQ